MKKVNLIIVVLALTFILAGCVDPKALETPIYFENTGWWDRIFVYPIAWLLFEATKIFGNFYFMGILITTLIVRTAGWPIYAKTNDTSMRMQMIQPEQMKIQAKYEGKKDRESQMRQQQEILALYRKYGVNLWGCLLPFLQMPIFMAVYYAVRKIPFNVGTGVLDLGDVGADTTIFGLDLFANVGDKIGADFAANFLYLIFPLLTGVTMYLVTYMGQMRTRKQQASVPTYRQNQQSQKMGKQMRIMMFIMIGLMVFISYISPAALGLYWTFGNIYAIIQTTINYHTFESRMAKLKAKV